MAESPPAAAADAHPGGRAWTRLRWKPAC